jgi:hypothetical protein
MVDSHCCNKAARKAYTAAAKLTQHTRGRRWSPQFSVTFSDWLPAPAVRATRRKRREKKNAGEEGGRAMRKTRPPVVLERRTWRERDITWKSGVERPTLTENFHRFFSPRTQISPSDELSSKWPSDRDVRLLLPHVKLSNAPTLSKYLADKGISRGHPRGRSNRVRLQPPGFLAHFSPPGIAR